MRRLLLIPSIAALVLAVSASCSVSPSAPSQCYDGPAITYYFFGAYEYEFPDMQLVGPWNTKNNGQLFESVDGSCSGPVFTMSTWVLATNPYDAAGLCGALGSQSDPDTLPGA